MCDGRTVGTAGPKWEGVRPVGKDDRRVDRDGKIFSGGRGVRLYGGASYQGGTGEKTGDGENNPLRNVQHPERPIRGAGIGTWQDGTGAG